MTGIASVVNPGLDRNWCGHHFSQSNWYASGRLAWNPELPADQIAEEWIRLTFTNDASAVKTLRAGADIALVVRTEAGGARAFDHMLEAARKKRLPRSESGDGTTK